MIRSTSRLSLLFLVLLVATIDPVRADESSSDAAPVAEPRPTTAIEPLAAAIEGLRADTLARLDELEARRARALGADAVLALEREIAHVKLDFELGVLRLQRDEFEALGRRPAVDELTTAIAALEAVRADLDDPDDRTPTQDETQEDGR